MKVSELFEANERGLKGGASYAPTYRDDIKQLRGSVKDWLDAMHVTSEDITKAMRQIKGTPLFRNDFPKAGLVYTPSEGREKNGTFVFNVRRKNPMSGKMYGTSYLVHANGQIRWAGDGSWGNKEYMSPLKSPKPRMKAGDPVGTLVMIYTAALEEVLAKWKKSTERMDKIEAQENKK